jgi:hypothetical protein
VKHLMAVVVTVDLTVVVMEGPPTEEVILPIAEETLLMIMTDTLLAETQAADAVLLPAMTGILTIGIPTGAGAVPPGAIHPEGQEIPRANSHLAAVTHPAEAKAHPVVVPLAEEVDRLQTEEALLMAGHLMAAIVQELPVQKVGAQAARQTEAAGQVRKVLLAMDVKKALHPEEAEADQ